MIFEILGFLWAISILLDPILSVIQAFEPTIRDIKQYKARKEALKELELYYDENGNLIWY